MRDREVSQPVLYRAGVDAVIGELVAAAHDQHRLRDLGLRDRDRYAAACMRLAIFAIVARLQPVAACP